MWETGLPRGYRARPPSREDAPQVAAMSAAFELDVFGNTEMTGELLLDDWSDLDSEQDAIAVFAPDNSVAAAAHLFNHSGVALAVYGYVHPDHRDRDLSTLLVQWAEQRARDHLRHAPADASITVRQFPALPDESGQRMLAAQGYTRGRGFYVMELALDEVPPPPDWPEGISVRSFDFDRDEQATFATLKTSFQDHWSGLVTAESFQEMIDAASFDPGLWHLAFDGEEMAGICLSEMSDGSGWIESIGVLREWRRRGVGLAMLRHAFGEFHKRGAPAVGLSVDAESPTGAPRLFERAGMQVKRSYVLYEKELHNLEKTPSDQ